MSDISKVNEMLYREVGERTVAVEEWRQLEHANDTDCTQVPMAVPLSWDTPSGEQTVYATKKPLGIQFRAEFPLKVKREPEGHGKEIGIRLGWVLKRINGIDVTTMSDINKVNEVLYREVG